MSDPAGIVQNMTTTSHQTIEAAGQVIESAADLLAVKWHRAVKVGNLDYRPSTVYGVPEAVVEAAAGATVEQVVAERQLVTHGIDVWWNDLLCQSAAEAAQEVRAQRSIAPEELYGDRWEANLGLLVLASVMTPAHLNGLSNMVHAEHYKAYMDAVDYASAANRDRLLMHLCEDLHFVVAHHETTPAAVQRRLKGIRALECVAAHHVLMDVIPVELASTLVEPVARMIPSFSC